jgi:1-acyl-sn-glycerol-3-phosphate acyltransferase
VAGGEGDLVRRPGKQGPIFRVTAIAVRLLNRLIVRRRWNGQEHVPRQGGAILAANHLTHIDPLTLAHFVYKAGRIPRFLAKSELFRAKGLGMVLRGCRQVPVHRGGNDAVGVLRDAVTALEGGEALLIYPEGTITRDPQLWPMVPKTGVARLALETGAPVIPVAHWGEQEIMPPYSKKLRLIPRKTVHVTAGPAVDLSPWAGMDPSPEVLRAISEAVMGDVTRLLAGLRGEAPPAEPFRMSAQKRSA